ncbi:hypothetical protein AAVH_26707 [Aphelenchoides avenae]|nr:hypothetical protein AAVH_26707 [Aphelenchus avenae]
MYRLVVLLLFVAGMVALSEALTYGLYPNKWQEGTPVEGSTDAGCQKTSILVGSVNTGGGCIMLCSRSNCKGRCVRVAVGESSDCADHGNLDTCDFHHKAKSVKGC